MREIKFRAWDKERGEMLPPEQICHLEGDVTRGIETYSPFLILMQFTGLHDIRGKKIYEGDIIKYQWDDWNDPSIIPVKWDERTASFGFPEDDDGNILLLEIIGNIYENPELVGGQDD